MPCAPHVHLSSILRYASPATRSNEGSGWRGFTLIELLTVIAIIGVLAGLLIATLGPVRQRAHQATCISRQRQLGVAFQLYANENRDCLLQPKNDPDHRWPILVAPWLDLGKMPVSKLQMQPIFRCPTQSEYSDARGIFGYNMTLEESGDPPSSPVRLASLSNPRDFPVLATSDGSGGGGQRLSRGGPPSKAKEYGYIGNEDKFGPSPNFRDKAIFLFADWHVEARGVCDRNQWPWKETDTTFLPK
ncbi:MAG: type II secretion system GspH family protein [Opitutaceae bacterium]|jgi:prepilin-type N-terminal cleavage/methylation domain-containing protein/prepilin-type processing-associated H-X9-DG protein|nr:type II secretion system GspH family protein [Opitutaceae bacterium]